MRCPVYTNLAARSPATFLQSQQGRSVQQDGLHQPKTALQQHGPGAVADPQATDDLLRVVGLGQRGISAAARLMCK